MMSADSINTALAELENLINSCENDLIRFIEARKMNSGNEISTKKVNRQLQQNPIAIVGMASLLPQSRNLRQYWQNIVSKADCITDVPESHWSVKDYYDPNPRTPEDKTYCKRGGFIPEVDFNPMEFGIPPSILEVTDVSQLLSLVVAKEAMEDAGYGEAREFNRENVGVILGVAMAKQLGMPLSARLEYPVWEKVLISSGLSPEDTQKIVEKIKSAYIKWDENAFPGMLANVVAGRIANRLNFGGMNCVVDAACASSFGALKMAISELVEYRSDMMLTGGVDTDNTIMAYISFSKTPAVSPGENVKPFDAKSDGMMLGEGIAMLVLKRLEDAQKDGDRIYAVIKGIGTSSDGRYKSIYAPRKEGQVKALERAYNDAGFSPTTLGLMEAHGTGTMAGDPTEFASLQSFFSKHDERKQYIALGSVKSQIGHTKAAAGAASLVKTALALYHKILPPTINITEPNPKLDIENSCFYLNTETRPWIRGESESPRRAGVSSFGFGGTNYHLVLEEYQQEQQQPYRLHDVASQILFSAPNPSELIKNLETSLENLQAGDGNRYYSQLVEECRNIQIPQNAARIGFVAGNKADACKLLALSIDLLKNKQSTLNWEHPQGIYYRASGIKLRGKVVALFSGQGSQYLEMGREAVMNFPALRRLYGLMDSLLIEDNLQPISQVVFPHPTFNQTEKADQIATLQRTEYAQPAIGVFSAGLYSIFQQAGFKSDFTAGHSFGELTALLAAGVLSESDYLYLVKARGKAMAAPKDPDHDAGSMLAVKEEISKVELVLKNFPKITIANFNSPSQVVLAGPSHEIQKIHQKFQDLGYGAVLLPVAAAFHTPLIAFAQKSFAIATKSVKLLNPKIPVFSNVTAQQYPQESDKIQRILESHLASSVNFTQQIENIYAAGGYCFVEFGPKRILTNLVKDILGERPHITISLNPSTHKSSDISLREAAVQLQVLGMELGNIDPYQLPEIFSKEISQKSLNVKLKGINYVSEKTKNAFEKALNDGFKIQGVPQIQPVLVIDKPSELIPEKEVVEIVHTTNGNGNRDQQTSIISSLSTDSQMNSANPINSSLRAEEQLPILTYPMVQVLGGKMTISDKNTEFQQVLASLENLLSKFQNSQSDNLQIHDTYLQHQIEYAKTFFQLVQQQNTLFMNNKSPETGETKKSIMDSFERSMMQFHHQQAETLRIHEQYLREQLEHTKNFFHLIQQEYSLLIDGAEELTPVIPLQLTDIHTENLREISPQNSQLTVSEMVVSSTSKTLEVEIPQPTIIETQPVITPIPETRVEQPPVPVTEIAISSQTKKSAIDIQDIGKSLLSITSEKTGYPIEMLEFDMDMEADLGIDSIKRVEILGGLQELYPDLPKPNLEELAEKRTIGQIVEYLEKQVLTNPTTNQVNHSEHIVKNVDPKVTSELIIPSPVDIPHSPPTSDEYSSIAETLLKITSEKTGYPVEMLELDMDMEADLGIDSIKRVEILGGMQEVYPDLPKPNLEELGDLRTIRQIVNYLQSLVVVEKKNLDFEQIKATVVDLTPPPTIDPNLPRRPVKLKILPEPDFWECQLPGGHIGLITDDGSLTTTKLVHGLIDKGWKVVVLSFPQSIVPERSPLPVGVTRINLANMSEEHLQLLLQSISVQYGKIGAFIHLHPYFSTTNLAYLEAEKVIVKHIFLIAKHLKQSLNNAANLEGRVSFCTVVHLDGTFGLDHTENFGIIGGGLFGLTKSLRWEWPKVFLKAIDLSPKLEPHQSAEYIVAELYDSNRYIGEVGYGSKGRVTLVATAD